MREQRIMAEFNTSEGEIGVYAGHIPLTVILKPGVLTLTEESGKKKAALHTGFAEIFAGSDFDSGRSGRVAR